MTPEIGIASEDSAEAIEPRHQREHGTTAPGRPRNASANLAEALAPRHEREMRHKVAKAEQLAAWIKREVDRSPPLSPDQIEKLRGLLPYPYPADSAAA